MEYLWFVAPLEGHGHLLNDHIQSQRREIPFLICSHSWILEEVEKQVEEVKSVKMEEVPILNVEEEVKNVP